MKNLYPLGLLFLSSLMFSQEKIPFVNFNNVLTEVNKASEQQDYDKILSLLNTINKNDSTHCSVQTTKSYYLITQKKYEESIALLEEALKEDCDNNTKLYFYINKGVSLTNLDRHQEAIDNYESAIELFPANAQLRSNKGIALENSGQIDKAIESYKQAIIINPWYRNAHLRLGSIYYRQQLMAQALMCYNMCLMIEPDNDRSFDFLKSLNDLVSKKNESEPDPNYTYTKTDKAFEEINLILDNKIALNSKFEIPNKIDIALVKQNYAMLQKIESLSTTDDFWSQTYIPYFKWIAANDKFEEFTYTINYSIQNEKFKKIIEKQTEEIKEFLSQSILKWYGLVKDIPLNKDHAEKNIVNHYNNRNLQANGKMSGETAVGPWVFYNENGMVSGTGSYNEKGERHNLWTWYFDNRQIKETANYIDGKLNGENKHYYENGNLRISTSFKNDNLEGTYDFFSDKGALKHTKKYVDGKLEGKYYGYFDTGKDQLEFDVDYKNGVLQGDLKEFYSDGSLYSEINYNAGKIDGTEINFYSNGQKSSEANYTDGELSGNYISYFEDGSKKEVGQAIDGSYSGSWNSYYVNGQLNTEYEYDNGQLNNQSITYDVDGKLYNEFSYRKGEIIGYKFYDKSGKIISENRKKGGEFYYKGVYPNGNVSSEGLYDISGGKTGSWKFYDHNGQLTEEGNYKDNHPVGIQKSYYSDGSVMAIVEYDDEGRMHGYYQYFHLNGKLKSQGYYQDGQEYGEWRSYYLDSKPSSINFYHKGQLHGTQTDFAVDGTKNHIAQYKYGNLMSETYFNPDGTALETINYATMPENSVQKYKHYNSKTNNEATFKFGIKHGLYTHYDYYGNKLLEGKFLVGNKHGKWTWYYPNGDLSTEENYVMGELEGPLKSFYENGTQSHDYTYSSGKKVGEWLVYHENGNLYTRTEYDNDQMHGRKEFYSHAGKLQLVRFYERDRLVGYSYLGKDGKEVDTIKIENETVKIVSYFDNGNKAREMEYINGDLTGDYLAYYYNGQLENHLQYDKDEYNGFDKEFYEDGTLKAKIIYAYGERHGLSEDYYSNGQIKESAQYLNDQKHGKSVHYDKNGEIEKTEIYFNGLVYESSAE